MTPNRGFSSFGMRADMERRGVPVDPQPEPEPVDPPKQPRKPSTIEVMVTPVLDHEAMVAVTDEITARVRAAFQQGIREGLAEAEQMLGADAG